MTAGLIIDQNGALYGTTYYCGSCFTSGESPPPTAFKLVPPGPQDSAASISVFTFNFPNFAFPTGRLLLDATGALIGTLTDPPDFLTGLAPGYDVNIGFRLVPPPAGSNDWTASYLYFPGGTLGVGPNGSIIEDANGAFYGTMVSGGDTVDGAAQIPPGCGTVFQLTVGPAPGAYGEAALSFDCNSALSPRGGLVMNANGSIFGTAATGGPGNGSIVYELDQPYGYATLKLAHAFASTSSGGVASDGFDAAGDLAIDTNGNVFGTTYEGGIYGYGIIYMYTP